MANFSSKAAYGRWLAYGHSTGVFEKTPGNTPVEIKGKSHKVKHVSTREALNKAHAKVHGKG